MRRWVGILCIVALLFTLGAMPAGAATQVFYQLALNDRLPANTAEVTPIEVDGVMYIPYTVFDKTVTETDLGVYASQSRTDSNYTVTVYSFNGLLTFDLNANTCVDREGTTKSMRAVIRNSRVYLPASAVCSYFGLGYALYATSYGNLLRITNGNEEFEGFSFLTVAADWMVHRYNEYLQGITSQTVTIPAVTATPTPTATVRPTTEDVEVFLAFDCGTGTGLSDIITQLDARGWQGIFFFSADEIVTYDDEIRRMVATGHAVGLSTQGETWEEIEESLLEGSELLEVVARIQPHMVLTDQEDYLVDLVGAGWTCWQTNVDGLHKEGETTATMAYRITQNLDVKTQWGQVLMDDSLTTAVALSSILSTVYREGYEVKFPSESAVH